MADKKIPENLISLLGEKMTEEKEKLIDVRNQFPAKATKKIDTERYTTADTSEFLKRRKMLGASTKDIVSSLVRATPIGRAGRIAGKIAKATGLMGAGYGINEAEDVIKEKMEKKKTGGAVFLPRGQKAFQVNKQKSRIV